MERQREEAERLAKEQAAHPRSTPRASGRSCRDLIDDIGTVVSASDPFQSGGPLGPGTAGWNSVHAQEEGVWAFQTYVRAANAIPVCANDSASRAQLLQTLQNSQGYCQNSARAMRSAADCINGRNWGNNQAAVDAAVRAAISAGGGSAAAAAAPASAPRPAAPSGASCSGGMSQLTAEFNAINARNPNDGNLIASLQVALYELDKTIRFLDASCRGTSEYNQYSQFKAQYDQTMRTCQASASNSSVCVPKVAW
jgi:hypothetical protein